MRIKYSFVSFFLWAALIVPEKAFAQQPFLSWDRLTLRKTFQSTLSLSDPASVTVVAPKGEKSSYSINAALGYNIAWDEVSEHVECNITLEYHRDNQLKREQDVLQSGIAYDWTPLTLLDDGWSPVISGKFDFKRDGVDSSDLLQAAVIVKDSNRCASVGVDYTKGEDPSLGLSDQDFLTIAFKIKL